MNTVKLTNDWAGELKREAAGFDSALLVVSVGATRRGTTADAETALGRSHSWTIDTVPEMPDVQDIGRIGDELRGKSIDCIVAIGGGSVIDAAKGALLAINCLDTNDVASRIRNGDVGELTNKPRFIALPTTAGSGSEVTPFATIWDREVGVKRSIADSSLVPDVAIVDWTFLRTLQGAALLYPALDTVSHAMESLWSRSRSSRSYLHAITALRLSTQGLAMTDSVEHAYPWLSLASVHAGLAIAESRTALAHAMSYPLSLRFGVPHGLACSFTLPALAARAANAFEKESAEWSAIQEACDLIDQLGLDKRMNAYCSLADMVELAPQMQTPGRADNYVVKVSTSDLRDILTESMSGR